MTARFPRLRRWLSRARPLLAFAALAAGATAADDNCGGSQAIPCNCYLGPDCGSEDPGACYNGPLNGCERNGKNDGTCRLDAPKIDVAPIPSSEATELLTLAFDAYEQPILAGGGHPNPALWAQIDAAAATPKLAFAARVAVYEALDATLGFDLNLAEPSEPGGMGNIRGVPDPQATVALLHATRDAVVGAIADHDPDAVAAPLQAFWAQHPGYHPMHTGRCYPHGHANVAPPLPCQVGELKRKVAHVLELLDPAL